MVDTAFVIRTGPSGPDMPAGTPGYVLTVQPDGLSVKPEPAAVPPAVGSCEAQAWSTDETNVFATNGTENYLYLAGSDFAEGLNIGSALVFTASQAKYVYTGPTIRAWVDVIARIENPAPATVFGSLGVDVDGDVVGQSSQTNSGDKGIDQASMYQVGGQATPSYLCHTRRLVQLVSGAAIRPVYGATTGGGHIGADTVVDRMNITITQVGPPD